VIYMRGQVSAEMLILLAVVIAIVALAATYLMNIGEQAGEHVEAQSTELLEQTSVGKRATGEVCEYDSQCQSRDCSDYRCA